MAKFGVGQAVTRIEDQRLLTGHGRFTDDFQVPGAVIGHVLRSPVAHAIIRRLDTARARAAPGVLGVFTYQDLAADGIGGLPCPVEVRGRLGDATSKPPRPVLADGRVRYVGEPVAFIVAETADQARDAAEAVDFDWDDLPVVTETALAAGPAAPRLHESAPGNLCFDYEAGDRAATESGIARAAHVSRIRLVNNRLSPAAMEPRVAIGEYDPATERYTLHTPSQGVHTIRNHIADSVLGIPRERLRVVTGDVGGGFGLKIFPFPEHALVTWAARRVGRPVRWTGDRGEGFLADIHGRDHVTEAELALDADGRFLALRVSTIAALGAYLSLAGPFIASSAGAAMLAGVYTLPAVYLNTRGVFTNTCPVDAYRGAGRPEAIYVVERLVDQAARETGRDPAALRRLNFIPADGFPYSTAMDQIYDSGDFAGNLDQALATADQPGFAARRAASEARGLRRGLGIAYYIERCGGDPDEQADIRFDDSGGVRVLIGNQSNGQGHETAFTQLLSERLGIPPERIEIVQGDSDLIAYGRGTGGSRSLPVGGSAIHEAAGEIIEKGRAVASIVLEADAADIDFADGRFSITGTDRALGIAEVATLARDPANLPEGREPGLDTVNRYAPRGATFPNGAHVCEIEVDPETGRVRIDRYVVVDDFGNLVNPLLVAGQVHGGIGQGLGQALLEGIVYDDSGQLLTGSFMDYTMPRADDLPEIGFAFNQIPCRTNPLGVKGCGEAGAIGAPPAIINGILDALGPLGVTALDMPATPERVWRAIRAAAGR